MDDKYKLLIVNDADRQLERLCGLAELDKFRIRTVGHCEVIGQVIGAIHVYEPDIIFAVVDCAATGYSLAEALEHGGFKGILCFYGHDKELEIGCNALSRGGCIFVDDTSDAVQIAEKLRAVADHLSAYRKMRSAVDSIFLGAPKINREYFSELLSGSDSEFLRLQLAVLDIDLPQSGCVIYGKTFNLHLSKLIESCYNDYKRACGDSAAGECWQDSFVMITPLRDVETLKNLGKAFVDENCAGHGELVVGISGFSSDSKSLVAAVSIVKALVTDNMFLPSCGIYTDSDSLLLHARKCKRLVGDALKLIREHYPEKISASWAAKRLFVSPSHLMHEFKKELNSTFNDCLTKYRIVKAKELLSSGTLRINEVASAVGFSDARYFGTVFKDVTGMSPGEYAKQQENAE